MLAEITPEQMTEIQAFELLEPDPLVRIAEILKLGFCSQCLSTEVTPENFEPKRLLAAKSDEPGLSPNQQVQLIRGIADLD